MSELQGTWTADAFVEKVRAEEAVLALFGGATCQVCHSIRPKLEEMLAQSFPRMKLLYVDCHDHLDLCAQQGVLTLPVAQVYIGGQKVGEWVRTFSPAQIAQAVIRPYELFFSA